MNNKHWISYSTEDAAILNFIESESLLDGIFMNGLHHHLSDSNLSCYCCNKKIKYDIVLFRSASLNLQCDRILVEKAYFYSDFFWCVQCLTDLISTIKQILHQQKLPKPIVSLILKQIFNHDHHHLSHFLTITKKRTIVPTYTQFINKRMKTTNNNN